MNKKRPTKLDPDLELIKSDDVCDKKRFKKDPNEDLYKPEVLEIEKGKSILTEEAMSDEFAAAISKILKSSVKSSDQNVLSPILSRSRSIERELDEAKLEYRARKVINMEKKKSASKDRVKTDFATIDKERKLRKVATKG
ncbi:2812_t:CDS:2, partial [Acaulospora colombiana]